MSIGLALAAHVSTRAPIVAGIGNSGAHCNEGWVIENCFKTCSDCLPPSPPIPPSPPPPPPVPPAPPSPPADPPPPALMMLALKPFGPRPSPIAQIIAGNSNAMVAAIVAVLAVFLALVWMCLRQRPANDHGGGGANSSGQQWQQLGSSANAGGNYGHSSHPGCVGTALYSLPGVAPAGGGSCDSRVKDPAAWGGGQMPTSPFAGGYPSDHHQQLPPHQKQQQLPQQQQLLPQQQQPWAMVGGELPDLSVYGASSSTSAGSSWTLDKVAPPLGLPRTPTEMRRGATELTLGYAPDAQRAAREHGYAHMYSPQPSPSLGSPAVQQQQQQQQQHWSHADALISQLAARAAPFDPGRIFEDWDGNRDARISREEFGRVAVRWLGYAVPVGDLDALFSALDVDGNGTLSRRELVLALQRR